MVGRWYYRQRMEARLRRGERPWVILTDPGCRAPWSGAGGSLAVEPVPVNTPDAMRRTRVVGFEASAADQQTIRQEADLLFVAGAGWTKKQADVLYAADAFEVMRKVNELLQRMVCAGYIMWYKKFFPQQIGRIAPKPTKRGTSWLTLFFL